MGGRLFEAGRLLTFSAFRMGAYSRWALIRGWALIRINTVLYNRPNCNNVVIQSKLTEYTLAVTLHKLIWEKFTTLLLATVTEIKSCILFSDQIPECGERVSFIPTAIFPHFFQDNVIAIRCLYY